MGVRRIVAAVALAVSGLSAIAAEPGSSEPLALPSPRDFAAAVAAVERAAGVKGQALRGEAGEIPLAEGRAFPVDSHTAERLLAGSHAAYREAGFYLFRVERSFGVGGEKDRLALLATADRNVVLRRIGTSGAHHKTTTEQIVAWLDALAKEEPFDLTEVGADYVAGRFERAPRDPAAIARRSAEIAPDLVAGRASTLALLAEEIRANRTLYLIW